jgi:hypothetical protein
VARYPYDAHTALLLLQVELAAPPGVAVDPAEVSALEKKILELSPKRSVAWYAKVNSILSETNTLPAGSERTAGYTSALQLLLQYEALVPEFSEPHFVLAELYHALGDDKNATREAELGVQFYTRPNLATAKRATTYFENVQDWEHALFFLKSILILDPSDDASLYNEAKVLYLTGDPSGAEKIVSQLRAKNPKILDTDPAFLQAIATYEAR